MSLRRIRCYRWIWLRYVTVTISVCRECYMTTNRFLKFERNLLSRYYSIHFIDTSILNTGHHIFPPNALVFNRNGFCIKRSSHELTTYTSNVVYFLLITKTKTDFYKSLVLGSFSARFNFINFRGQLGRYRTIRTSQDK